MNELKITGLVSQVLPLESGESKAGNAWKKQTFILETSGEYPRKVPIQLWGEAVDKHPVEVGQSITASINIEGREFNGRWYVDVRAWNIVAAEGEEPVQQAKPAAKHTPPATAKAPAPAPVAKDELPF